MSFDLSSLNVLILAGGLGTRLRSVVRDVPKPMAPVAGRPFIEHQLRFLASTGFKSVVIALGYRGDVIKQHFKKDFMGIQIDYSSEATPLGTGGAIVNAVKAKRLDGNLVVLNGDTFFPISIESMMLDHIKNSADVTLAIFRDKSFGRYSGLCLDDKMKVLRSDADTSEYKSAGIYIFSHNIVGLLRSKELKKISFEEDIGPKLISNYNVYGYAESAPFIDIGIPEDFDKAQTLLRRWQ
jgi:D-glycero-alpha-D-manno-heptose 1-phosphate guanylyltransferase